MPFIEYRLLLLKTLALCLCLTLTYDNPVSEVIQREDKYLSESSFSNHLPITTNNNKYMIKQIFHYSMDKMLQRPLFTMGRTLKHIQKPLEPAAPRLTGILIINYDRIALFAPEDEKVISVREGGIFGKFIVDKITKDKVILTGIDGTQEVSLTFDVKLSVPRMVILQLPMAVLTR